MIYICIVCTGRKPPLLSLSGKHRQILASIVSPTINLGQLKSLPLWICKSCQGLINKFEAFKKKALAGISRLLSRLTLVQGEQDKSEDSPQFPVKLDPDDLLESKSYVKIEIEETKKPQELEGDIKTEYLDLDDNHSETPDPPTNQQGHRCQNRRSRMLKTAKVEPAVSKPVARLPTLVLYSLKVPGSSAPADRQTYTLQLPKLKNKTGKVSTVTLHPLTIGGSTVENNSEDNKEKEIHDGKVSDLFLCRICGQRVPTSQIDAHTALHTTPYFCYGCCYETSDKGDFVRHRCDGVVIQKSGAKSRNGDNGGKAKSRASRVSRVKRPKPPKAFRCSECYLRFADEARLARHIQKYQKGTHDLHVCKVCKKEFKSGCRLKIHSVGHRSKSMNARSKESQSVDTIKPELFCAECGIQFQTKLRFSAHMKSLKHTPRDSWKFKCDTCEKLFFNKFELRIHVNNIHLKKPDYQCPHCHKVFWRRHVLRNHVAAVHEGKPKPRPHVCHVCGAAFTIKKCLTEHLTRHSDVRPHACPLCPATFKYKAALFTHNRLKHLKLKGNWKKPTKGKKEKKEQEFDAESLENAIEFESGD